MDSDASRLITDSLKELSRRAGERGERVVVKLMFDRGSLKQVGKSTRSMKFCSDTVHRFWTTTKMCLHLDGQLQE